MSLKLNEILYNVRFLNKLNSSMSICGIIPCYGFECLPGTTCWKHNPQGSSNRRRGFLEWTPVRRAPWLLINGLISIIKRLQNASLICHSHLPFISPSVTNDTARKPPPDTCPLIWDLPASRAISQ